MAAVLWRYKEVPYIKYFSTFGDPLFNETTVQLQQKIEEQAHGKGNSNDESGFSLWRMNTSLTIDEWTLDETAPAEAARNLQIQQATVANNPAQVILTLVI